jgi:pyruvate dehydrogenase E2 component (dihydrolipoamide acetyltransferase)
MPALGMHQDNGTLLAWLKEEGEAVAQGEPIMEIETDKATVEIEAPASGILGGIRAREGAIVPVGQAVAWILAPGEPLPGEALPAGQGAHTRGLSVTPVARRLAEKHGVDLAEVRTRGRRIEKDDVLRYLEAGSGTGRPRLAAASPRARRLARERGLDVEHLSGSGPGGAVLAADVLAAEALADRPGSTWQIMAERVTRSWTGAPHFYLFREVDAGRLVAWRTRAQQRIETGLTYTDLLIELVAAALSRHPEVNASWSEGRIALHSEINVGFAVAVQGGLLVPVVHSAHGQSLGQIAARRQDLVRRARVGKLSPEDMANGTFTITNLGMYGVDAFVAIINPPQAAILAVGRIADRVVPVDGRPAVRPTMSLGLSCDHRVVDGAMGARFLATLADLIEEPLLLYL